MEKRRGAGAGGGGTPRCDARRGGGRTARPRAERTERRKEKRRDAASARDYALRKDQTFSVRALSFAFGAASRRGSRSGRGRAAASATSGGNADARPDRFVSAGDSPSVAPLPAAARGLRLLKIWILLGTGTEPGAQKREKTSGRPTRKGTHPCDHTLRVRAFHPPLASFAPLAGSPAPSRRRSASVPPLQKANANPPPPSPSKRNERGRCQPPHAARINSRWLPKSSTTNSVSRNPAARDGSASAARPGANASTHVIPSNRRRDEHANRRGASRAASAALTDSTRSAAASAAFAAFFAAAFRPLGPCGPGAKSSEHSRELETRRSPPSPPSSSLPLSPA